MSVSQVKIISIIGILDKLDEVVNLCGKSENFQPDDALSFYSNTKKFTSLAQINPFSQSLTTLKEAASDLGKDLSVFDTRNYNISSSQINEYIDRFTGTADSLTSSRNKISSEITHYVKQKSELEHFVSLDVDLQEIFKCEFVKIRFGRLPRETFHKLRDYSNNPYVLFFESSVDATHHWGMYCVPADHKEEVDDIFSSLYFERLIVTSLDATPSEAIEEIDNKLRKLQEKLDFANKQIDEFWLKEKEECNKHYSKLKEYDTYYGIRNYGAKYRNSFIIVGWIPIDKQKEFEGGLSRINGIEFNIDNPEEAPKHIPPTLLKNKSLFRPYEFFVNMYGTPNNKEIDPTPFVCVTYFMIFGMMFGDLGHGFVLLILGILMHKLKGMALGKILIPCGVTSMLWGVAFGSFFGFEHAFDLFYKSVFHLGAKPIDVMEASTTTYILLISASIGVVLITVAMVMNIYTSIRQRRYGKAFFSPSGLSGLVFYVSIILGGVLQLALGIPVLSNPLFWVVPIAIPLVLMLFCEVLTDIVEKKESWKPEDGWGNYLVQNFFEMFEAVLSYLTNTVSFLRIGAYVLVHAGMLLVVSTLAEMFGDGTVVYWIIIVLGNLFVIGLEALLVGIQVLRLEFYEMFSRFYDGTGIPFTPVKVAKTH